MKNIFILRTLQSIAIWLATNGLAAAIYAGATVAGIQFEPVLCSACHTTLFYMVIVGLVISSPVIIALIPVLFIASEISDRNKRISFSVCAVLFLCAAVTGIFYSVLGVPGGDPVRLTLFLLPYAGSAVLSFLLVARKTIHYR